MSSSAPGSVVPESFSVPESLSVPPSPHPDPDPVAPVATRPGSIALGRLGGVELVRWPVDGDRRDELARRHEPCLLVLGPDEPVPPIGELEDWVRDPVDADDLAVRCEGLVRRAACGTPPRLDDGLLLHRGAWAAVPPAQVTMVEMLVARLGRVVTKDELAAAAAAGGGSDHEEAVKAAMGRLVKRLAPLGLSLRSIRGRGYLLELTDACPLHGTRSAAEAKDAST